MEILSVCVAFFSAALCAVFYFKWRRIAEKHSLKEAERLIYKFRNDFNGIVSDRLEITEARAVEITERFDAAKKEIDYFNQKMREAEALVMRFDNINTVIRNTAENNISRDEMIVAMNREIEELKSKVSGSGSNLSGVVAELVNGVDEIVGKLSALEKSNSKLRSDFDGFEQIIADIIGKVRVLEKRI